MIKDVLFDFFILGLPMFIFGNLTMLLLLMNTKFEWDSRHKRIRNKRIKYIYKLEGIVIKKRREEQKIDIDVD